MYIVQTEKATNWMFVRREEREGLRVSGLEREDVGGRRMKSHYQGLLAFKSPG